MFRPSTFNEIIEITELKTAICYFLLVPFVLYFPFLLFLSPLGCLFFRIPFYLLYCRISYTSFDAVVLALGFSLHP